MSRSLRVLITTDAFPPVCGGSGWSTWELSRGLAARGHQVDVLKLEAGSSAGTSVTEYEGFEVTTLRVSAPDLVVVRNIVKNERLWSTATSYLTGRLRESPVDIIHAQHVMSTVPSVRAGRATGTPVVATVRDYWPVCYWADLIHDPSAPDLCPGCSTRMMTRCIKPRAGKASVAAWSVIPYMRANLRRKRETLAKADAVIAVSSAIAADLEARAPEILNTVRYTIPNPVDVATLDRLTTDTPLDGPFILYAGKLATNKGVQFLPDAIAQARISWPLVVIGDGPLARSVESNARARGIDIRMMGWQDRGTVWRWMQHATVLAFPSYGPESLSRVLLEAAALGAPIAAMHTGGTGDILIHDQTGLLSTSPDGFAADLARLSQDDVLRTRLGAAARADVRGRFATSTVVARIVRVYLDVLRPEAA